MSASRGGSGRKRDGSAAKADHLSCGGGTSCAGQGSRYREARIAIVIGNAAYQAGALNRAAKDAGNLDRDSHCLRARSPPTKGGPRIGAPQSGQPAAKTTRLRAGAARTRPACVQRPFRVTDKARLADRYASRPTPNSSRSNSARNKLHPSRSSVENPVSSRNARSNRFSGCAGTARPLAMARGGRTYTRRLRAARLPPPP